MAAVSSISSPITRSSSLDWPSWLSCRSFFPSSVVRLHSLPLGTNHIEKTFIIRFLTPPVHAGGSLGVKTVSATSAFEGLSSDPATVLLDIRSKEEVKDQGSPNLASIKKKPISLPFSVVRPRLAPGSCHSAVTMISPCYQ